MQVHAAAGFTPITTAPQPGIGSGAPTSAELPALVAWARGIVEHAHKQSQHQVTKFIEEARDYLEVLPRVIDRAVAIQGIDRGVFWALEGTRILARSAHAKAEAVLKLPEQPFSERRQSHLAFRAQMDLVLERVRNAEHLVHNPWRP
jgi:hypothetical protein